MNNFANKFFRVFVIFFVFVFSNKMSIASDFGEDIFNDNNEDIAYFLDNTQFDITKATDPATIVEILVGEAKADEILKEEFFLKTNPLNKRSLLDNPIFIMDKDYRYGKWILGTSLFFEQTTRMHFTKTSSCLNNRKNKYEVASCIKSYLGIAQPGLLRTLYCLQEEIEKIFPDFMFPCVVKGLSLGQNLTAQERRAGLFFSLMGQIKNVDFRFKVPFYYSIRNFYLTPEERAAIANEFGGSDSAMEMMIARRYLISDKLGLGDLRFEFDFPVGRSTCEEMAFRIGGFATVPTAVSMIKGLYGHSFCPKKSRPKFSFTELFDLLQDEGSRCKGMDMIWDFGSGALDGLSSMLIDTELGNNRHFGLGFVLRTKTPVASIFNRCWTKNLFFKGKMSVEYLFPAKECRWFIEKCNPALFDKYDFKDESKAVENLAFLEKMFVDKFYPYVYDAKVSPGFIFMWASKLSYEANRWGINVGWDTWIKTREGLDDICAPSDQLPLLDVEKARRPWGYQWSVFGSLFYKKQNKKSRLYVGLNVEKTISSRGIGQPFKLSLSFERNF